MDLRRRGQTQALPSYDWQERSGRLPHIVPDGGADFYMRSMNGSVGWADVGILMPYRWAKLFGDETILRRFYDGMAKYARFMEKRCGRTMPIFGEHIKLSDEAKKYLVNAGQSYGGDWALVLWVMPRICGAPVGDALRAQLQAYPHSASLLK